MSEVRRARGTVRNRWQGGRAAPVEKPWRQALALAVSLALIAALSLGTVHWWNEVTPWMSGAVTGIAPWLLRVVGTLVIWAVLVDAMATLLVTRAGGRGRLQTTHWIPRLAWPPYREFARHFETHSEGILAAFAAFTISVAVIFWTIGIAAGFATIYWTVPNDFAWGKAPHDFLDAFYYSASTLTTLGYGDITASEPLTKVLSFFEVLAGLATISLVIAFIPTLFSGFTEREAALDRLNTGGTTELTDFQLLQYWFEMGGWDARKADFSGFLAQCDFWISWTTGLLESHAAHPILAYFRSRHYGMHWLVAARTLIDAATLACATMPAVASRHPAALRLALSRTLNQINGRLGGGGDRQANVDRATFDIAYRALQASHPALLRPADEAWKLYYDYHLEYGAQVQFLFDYLMVPKTMAPAGVA